MIFVFLICFCTLSNNSNEEDLLQKQTEGLVKTKEVTAIIAKKDNINFDALSADISLTLIDSRDFAVPNAVGCDSEWMDMVLDRFNTVPIYSCFLEYYIQNCNKFSIMHESKSYAKDTDQFPIVFPMFYNAWRKLISRHSSSDILLVLDSVFSNRFFSIVPFEKGKLYAAVFEFLICHQTFIKYREFLPRRIEAMGPLIGLFSKELHHKFDELTHSFYMQYTISLKGIHPPQYDNRNHFLAANIDMIYKSLMVRVPEYLDEENKIMHPVHEYNKHAAAFLSIIVSYSNPADLVAFYDCKDTWIHDANTHITNFIDTMDFMFRASRVQWKELIIQAALHSKFELFKKDRYYNNIVLIYYYAKLYRQGYIKDIFAKLYEAKSYMATEYYHKQAKFVVLTYAKLQQPGADIGKALEELKCQALLSNDEDELGWIRLFKSKLEIKDSDSGSPIVCKPRQATKKIFKYNSLPAV